MPLEKIDYAPESGEWFPHSNDESYISRVRSNYLFYSKNNETEFGTFNVAFTNTVTLGTSDTMANSWPIEVNGSVPTEVQTTFTPSPIYTVSYNRNQNTLAITIKGQLLLSTYELIFGTGSAEANEALQIDTEIYNEYKTNLEKILDDTNSDGMVGNFFGFNWGIIETPLGTFNCEDIVTEIVRVVSATETEAGSGGNFTTSQSFTVVFEVQNNQEFPSEMFSGGVSTWGSNTTDGVIEWNPSLTDAVLAGDIINLNAVVPAITIGQYIHLDSDGSLGRYQVTDIHEEQYLFVKRIDGEVFQTGTHNNTTIKNLSLQPRLRIKYRLPDSSGVGGGGGGGGSVPRAMYKFYSQQNADLSYKPAATNSSREAREGLESDEHQTLIEVNELFNIGYSRSINGIGLGNLSWGVNTTKVDQSSTGGRNAVRVTPWRKGYRVANRFVPKEVTVRKFGGSESSTPPNLTDAYLKQEFTLGIARSTNTGDAIKYPEAMLHSPILVQHESPSSGGEGKGNILFTTAKKGSVEVLSGFGEINDIMGHPFDVTVPREDGSGNATNGYILEESVPNQISFTANMEHEGNSTGRLPAFNFTGEVSTKYGVIPAYSGEITAADNVAANQMTPEHGFIKFNYSNSDLGITNQFAVFLDISETDEVLRWNGSNYDADEIWRNTFSSLQIRNVTTGKVVVIGNDSTPSYKVKKSSKTNYVVVMHTDMSSIDTTFTISTDDEITIEFINKKVIQNYQLDEDPSSPTTPYVPIAYRPLEDEDLDDLVVTEIERNLSDFTITSDGLLETGNITINYDGDVPDGTEFRLFIEDEEDEG